MVFLLRLMCLLVGGALFVYTYGPRGVVTTAFYGGQMTAAQKETADCIARYRKGLRRTDAGC
jgi:hypothetical protein